MLNLGAQLLQGALSNRLPEMTAPSQPPAPSATQHAVQDPAPSTWLEQGGVRGFLDGRQSLALAFWVLGVGVAVFIALAGLAIDQVLPRDAFLQVLLLTTLLTIATRVFAWYAIIRCRRNTRSDIFSAMALTAVAFDIVMGVFKWPAVLFALSVV
jgi:hypothetical protein